MLRQGEDTGCGYSEVTTKYLSNDEFVNQLNKGADRVEKIPH